MPFREEARRFCTVLQGKVIPLGMGCATIGGAGNAEAQRRFARTLEAAYEGGMRYFDTSAAYGGSEFRLGRFLCSVERERVFVASKCPIPTTLTPSEAALHVRQGFYNSLERLGVDWLDLFLIHDVASLDVSLAPGGPIEALLRLREQGLIRYIGLGTRSHDLLRTAVAHPEFDAILTHLDYNLLDRSASPLIAFARERNAGVLNGSPLAIGLLTGRDPRSLSRVSPAVSRHYETAVRLYDFCRARDIPLLALALQYPMRSEGVSLTLTGPGSPEEVSASLAACTLDIPAEIWQEVEALLKEPPD